MFTGIILHQGKVEELIQKEHGAVLKVRVGDWDTPIEGGESIANNGVCLTVAGIEDDVISFDLLPETLRCTTLGALKSGAPINLERSLELGDKMGGHMVFGHVDCMARMIGTQEEGSFLVMSFEADPEHVRMLVPKGSVALDGISLTVGPVREREFEVYLIPETLERTTLGTLKPGEAVNLEIDMLARYVHQYVSAREAGAQAELDPAQGSR
ncbi:MAG: riboflavin synthase [Candidatus Omnitrophica bacterium]|nr:riboflavin synthase [Candidatus Omnitrophota bacterium]